MNYKNKKSKIFLLAAFFLFFIMLAIPASSAHASIFPSVKETVLTGVNYVIFAILSALGKVLMVVASFATYFIRKPFNLAGVNTGALIVRDVANLFFVLILLIISFATILRIESYGVKSVLGYLIIAALLINFSVVIVKPLIDLSNAATNTFLEGNVGEELVNGLNVANFISPDTNGDISKSVDQGNVLETIMMSMLFGIVFEIIAIFIIGALGLMFMVRMIAIQVLLIISPMVWVMWILPATKNYWHDWWKNFIKWVTFAPAASFFVFLAIHLFGATTGSFINYAKEGKDLFNMEILTTFLLAGGFLVGGLIVAQKTGIAGADMAMKAGQGILKSGKGYAGSQFRQRTAPMVEKALPAISKVPLLRTATKPLAKYAAGARTEIEQQKKEMQGLSPTAVNAVLQAQTGTSILPQNRATVVAAAQAAAEKGSLNIKDDKTAEQIVKTAHSMQATESIFKARPDYAKYTINKKDFSATGSEAGLSQEQEQAYQTAQFKAVQGAFSRIPAKEADKMQLESFGKSDPKTGTFMPDKMAVEAFMAAATPEHIKTMSEKAPKKLEGVRSYIRDLQKDKDLGGEGLNPTQTYERTRKINPQLANYILTTPAQKLGITFGQSAELAATKKEVKKTELREKAHEKLEMEEAKKELKAEREAALGQQTSTQSQQGRGQAKIQELRERSKGEREA